MNMNIGNMGNILKGKWGIWYVCAVYVSATCDSGALGQHNEWR